MRHPVGVAVNRRLWTGAAVGSAVGALAAALALSLFSKAAPACALAPSQGRASHYEIQSGGGNCGYDRPPADDLYVALGPAEYAGAAACGGYLRVEGPHGSVRVKVVDQCPACKPGELDLSERAFARLAPLGRGLVPITYGRVTDPPMPPMSFTVRKGSSAYWLSLSVLDHGNPLTRVRAKAPGRPWQTLVHTGYNAWQATRGLGPGPFTVEVADDRGHRATASGIRLAIGALQPTRVRLYGAAPPKPSRPATPEPETSPTGRPAQTPPPAEAAPPPRAAVVC